MGPDRIVLVSEEDVLRAVKTKGRRSGGGGSRGQLIVLSATGAILHIYVTFMSVSLTALWLSPGHISNCLLVVGDAYKQLLWPLLKARSWPNGSFANLQGAHCEERLRIEIVHLREQLNTRTEENGQ